MRKVLLLWMVLINIVSARSFTEDSSHVQPLVIRGSVRPQAPISVVGQKSGIFGKENGIFEAWIFPYQILHDFQLAYQDEDHSAPVPLTPMASDIEVLPEATTITYSHPLFSIREKIFAPIDQAALVTLLEVDSYRDLTIVAGFFPDMEPMWPAGLGGQYAFWDDKSNAYIISESRGLRNAFIGSPAARPLSSPPAHELAQTPSQFALDVKRANGRVQTFPIVIAAHFASHDSARAVYESVQKNHYAYLEKTRQHYQRLRRDFLSVKFPDAQLTAAFEWSKVALDKGLIKNPDLGPGLVAGFGPSGASQRPGFGWFFGGDCFINSFAMAGYGDFATVQTAFRFLRKHQRADGKMMHELTQAAALINWFGDYPYGYIHGDTTPYYLAAMWNYFLSSADLDFLRESWPSLLRAYNWCRTTDADADGLMENTRAGLGASEVGSLREKTGIDIFLASVGVEAWRAMHNIATQLDQKKIATEAGRWHQIGLQSLEMKFWNEEKQIYNFSITQQGSPNPEVTAWAAFPMTFRQLDSTHSQLMLSHIAASEICTDWGSRMLSRRSEAYDPLAYNNGAVWPFLTGYEVWALFNYGRFSAGWQMLRNLAQWTFVDARGYMPEVVSGEYFRPLATSVPHQLFSSFGFSIGVTRGLLGLEPDAQKRLLKFAPAFPPDWREVKLRNVRVGNSVVDLRYKRNLGGMVLTVERAEGEPLTIEFAPRLEAGAVVENGTSQISLAATKGAKAILRIFEGFWLELPQPGLIFGQRAEQLRVVEERLTDNQFTLICEGVGGKNYQIKLHSPWPITAVNGGHMLEDMSEDKLEIKFDGTEGEYERREVVIEFEKE